MVIYVEVAYKGALFGGGGGAGRRVRSLLLVDGWGALCVTRNVKDFRRVSNSRERT